MNAYADVIPLLVSDRDWHALVVEIARKDPAAVVKAAQRLDAPPPRGTIPKAWIEPWREPVIRMLRDDSGDIVRPIKYVREETHLGLKEAKDIVDAMRAQLGLTR